MANIDLGAWLRQIIAQDRNINTFPETKRQIPRSYQNDDTCHQGQWESQDQTLTYGRVLGTHVHFLWHLSLIIPRLKSDFWLYSQHSDFNLRFYFFNSVRKIFVALILLRSIKQQEQYYWQVCMKQCCKNNKRHIIDGILQMQYAWLWLVALIVTMETFTPPQKSSRNCLQPLTELERLA